MANFGKFIRDFAPSETNRRNSEGAFIRLDSGAIAFVFTRYRGGHEDGDGADLAVSFSFDEGESFSDERVILKHEDCGAMNIMSVSLLALGDGQIGVYYLKKSRGLLCQLFMRKTRDFLSFSDEKICTDIQAYMVVNNDRVRRLSDGRVVFPAAHYDLSTKPADVDNDNYPHQKWRMPPSDVYFYSSQDGENFSVIGKMKNPFAVLQTGADNGLQEPGVVECADGRLYMYIRSMSGRQLESTSYDGGKTWSEPTLSPFTSPPSPMSSIKMKNGDVLLGYNPAPLYFGRSQVVDGVWTGGRTPYVLQLCDSNLNFKRDLLVVEDDERSGYCYCAMIECADGLLMGYCAGGFEDKGGTLTRLRIRKVGYDEIYK